MKHLALSAFIVGLLIATDAGARGVGTTTMQFGIDVESLDRAHAKGLDFSFGTIWAGGWTQKYGWNDVARKLRLAKAQNAIPVINWWYWGDDISPDCVTNGCRDRYHGVHKDARTWSRMSDELSDLIADTIGNRAAYVVLEPEFNKNGIETYEPFDSQLADVARILRRRGNIQVVLGFGNWGREHWTRFDRAVGAADFVGLEVLRSSVRDAATYDDAVSTLIESARYVQKQFNKPALVSDLAMSSYPSSRYETRQAEFAGELRVRLPELKAAGVRAILYRMIVDDPHFDTNNYHGVAERHWGFLRADGSEKPAFAEFAATVRSEAPGKER